MKNHLLRVFTSIVIALAAAGSPISAAVIIKFKNLRPDATTVPAYVSFGGAGTLTGTNLADQTPLSKDKSYKLSDLSAGVSISEFHSGRIYVALGVPLTTANAGNGYSTNFANPTLNDYSTRWDKIEISYVDNDGGANLSSQDFFGIPLQITTTGGAHTPSNLTWRETTANVFHELGKLSNFAVSSPQNATGAIALGNNGVAVDGVTGGNVVRIISPASVSPTDSQGDTCYPSLATYVSYLANGNPASSLQAAATIIAGHNGQIVDGGPFQTYNLKAYIDKNATTIAGSSISPGDLIMDGTINNGSGDETFTLLIPAANLSDHAAYGANPGFQVIRGVNTNSVAEKVTADYFAALNLGLLGSTVDNPALPGTPVGASPSWTWYGNRLDGLGQPKLPISDAFEYAQPTNVNYYNQYAAYLSDVSDTYGFAYNDRLQSPLASLDGGSTLTLSILPDVQELSDSEANYDVLNSATLVPGGRVAPGSIAVVTGDFSIGSQVVAPGLGVPLPTSLSGVSVRFSGSQEAPIFSAAPGAALIQVPWELNGSMDDTIVVEDKQIASAPQFVQLAKTAPGIFTVDASGIGQGSIYDAAYRLVDQSHPAAGGQDIVIYCTGLGAVDHPPATGAPTPLSPLTHTVAKPYVFIGGVVAPVTFSGLTPGSIGLYQINARIPARSMQGDAVPVQIEIGGAISNTATIAVHETP
jgi:uncharacterized protein (TIGR03437 family)